MISIYTDGSCRGNGKEENTGGWAIAAFWNTEDNKRCIEFTGEQEENTTNNRMELTALLEALKLTQEENYKQFQCEILTDSAYCANICNEWIWNWQSKGWVRANNQPIENLDLIKEIYTILALPFNNFVVKKVSGHSGLVGNELVDAVATHDFDKLAKIMEENEELFVVEENIDND